MHGFRPILILTLLVMGALLAMADVLSVMPEPGPVRVVTGLMFLAMVPVIRNIVSLRAARWVVPAMIATSALAGCLLIPSSESSTASAVCWIAISAAGAVILPFLLADDDLASRESEFADLPALEKVRFGSAPEATRPLTCATALEADSESTEGEQLDVLPFFTASEGHHADVMTDEVEASDDSQLLQRWVRSRCEEYERLEGTVNVEFAPDQKQVYIHLPFAPMFPTLPVGHCESDEGSRILAEFDDIRRYGGRLTVRRRTDLQTAETVQIWVSLSASVEQRRAA